MISTFVFRLISPRPDFALNMSGGEHELRAFAAEDPAVTSGTAQMEIGRMLAGFVRPG